MSASPSEDESQVARQLGLNRGRRVLAGCLVAGLLVWTAHALFQRQQSSSAPQLSEVPTQPTAAPAAEHPSAVRPAVPKRRSKSARTASHGSLRAAAVEREPTLSAPPLLSAAVEVAPVEKERAGFELAEVNAGAPAAAPIQAAPIQAAPEVVEPEAAPPAESAAEITDDGNGEAIARSIADEKRAAVQTCFERELKQTPSLKGTLIVELDLAPPHRVNGVRVTDDLERPAFTRCVSSSMEHLTFVALNEEVSVRVPYVLSSRSK